MTMIVPAGNNKLDWSPKGTKFQKTASDGQGSKDIEVDALYEAAKGVVEAGYKEDEEKSAACGDGVERDEEAIVLDVEEVPEEGMVEEVSEEGVSQSVSEAVAEVEQKAEDAEAVVEQVEDAIEKIEEAVEGVRAVTGGGDNEGDNEEDNEEVEVEIEEIGEGDDLGEVPGEEEVEEDEVIVEGGKERMAKGEASMGKSASTEEFCKYAKLSPQNKTKLKNYWTNMLGYPKDFVDLMTKDYEK